MRLRKRLILALAVCGLLAAVVWATAFYFTIRWSYVRAAEESLAKQTVVLARQFGTYLDLQQPSPELSLAEEVAGQTGSRVTLIDSSGRVILDSDEEPSRMENHLNRLEVRQALATGRGLAIRWSSTLKCSMLYVAFKVNSPGGQTGVLRLSVPLRELRRAMLETLPWFLGAAAVSVTALLAAAILISARISRPVETMIGAARRMASGELREHIFEGAEGEIAELGRTLNFLATSLGKTIRELEHSERKLWTILEASVSGILVVDGSGTVVMANRACSEILKETRESLERTSYVRALRNTELADMLKSTLESGTSRSAEIYIGPPAQRTVYAYSVPIDAAGRREAVLILHDITHLRRLETVRSDFVQNVSHELKTPVTIIQGYAETLRDAPPEDPQIVKKMADTLANEARRLAALVRDLLELARLESGPARLDVREVDPAAVVREVLTRMAPLAAQKGLTLVGKASDRPAVDVPGLGGVHPTENTRGVSVTIRADRTLVERALTNLVDNAIKYTPSQGTVEVWVEDPSLCRKDLGRGALFVVRDTGPGIPEQHVDRIFERFYRASEDRSRDTGGTGLGLALVKHWVAVHGGKVWVESRVGRGSTFYMYFPENPSSPRADHPGGKIPATPSLQTRREGTGNASHV